jgi:hypothetical protein
MSHDAARRPWQGEVRPATEESGSGGGSFELTVEGALGPVLRCALGASIVGESQVCATLRGTGTPDLMALVDLLDANGLLIEDVWVLPVSPGCSSRPARR